MEERGGHGFLPTIVGCAMRGGGGQEKNTPNNGGGGGGFPKFQGKKSKLIIAPPLHKL